MTSEISAFGDPACKHLAMAFFSGRTLVRTQHFRSKLKGRIAAAGDVAQMAKSFCAGMGGVSILRLEQPSVWGRNGRGDANDILGLVYMNATVAEVLAVPDTALIPVNDWKGTVPKDVMNKRVWGRLTVAETALFPKRAPNHNVLDAIGLGLYYHMRLGR